MQLQAQKQLLAEKHKELFDLDSQIYEITHELKQKRSKEGLNGRNVLLPPYGSVVENDDLDDLYLDDCDIKTNDQGWEINCDMLDNTTPFEVSPCGNGVSNGYQEAENLTNHQKQLSSADCCSYIDIGPSTSRFQHVKPRRLEVLCEEEENGRDIKNNATGSIKYGISLKDSLNSSRAVKIKTLPKSELDRHKSVKDERNILPYLGSNYDDCKILNGESRISSTFPSNETNQLNRKDDLEIFEIDNVELCLSEDDENYKEINSTALQKQPLSKSTPVRVTPIIEVSPLSSPSSLSSMSSFSSLSSSTKLPAYSSVDSNHSTANFNETKAKELLPQVMQGNIAQPSSKKTEKMQYKTMQASSVQQNKLQMAVAQFRTIQPVETQTISTATSNGEFIKTHQETIVQTDDLQNRTLIVTNTKRSENHEDSGQVMKVSSKMLDISDKDGEKVPYTITNNVQDPPQCKEGNGVSSSVPCAADCGCPVTKSQFLPVGDNSDIRQAQQNSKPSSVVPSPSVKDLVSAFNGISIISPKDSNRRTKTKRLQDNDSVPKFKKNFFYSTSSNGNGPEGPVIREPNVKNVVSSLKIKLSGSKTQLSTQDRDLAVKPLEAAEVECGVLPTRQRQSKFSEKLSAVSSTSLSKSYDIKPLSTFAESFKQPSVTKEEDKIFNNRPNALLAQNDAFTPDESASLNQSVKTEKNLTNFTDGPALGYRPNQKGNGKILKRVSLDPHAVFLDASMEGELELVKTLVHNVCKFLKHKQSTECYLIDLKSVENQSLQINPSLIFDWL